MRIYIEKKHYTKKQGGGSFYEWYDLMVGGSGIEVSHLHGIGTKKTPPRHGSGSGQILSYKEAKVLIKVLQKAIAIHEREQGI